MLKYSLAAVALVATTAFAFAEPMDQGGKNAGAPSAKEYAPGQMKGEGSAKDFAPGQRHEEGSSAKQLSPGHEKSGSATSEDKNLGKKSENLDRGSKDRDFDKNANSRDLKKDTDRNADTRDLKKDTDRNVKNDKDDRDKSMRREESRDERKDGSSATGASEGTEGRSGRGSLTGVSEEQRTRVKSVFTTHHVEPARDIGVAVNIGVRLPHAVHLYPVPEDVVVIVPEYRGYDYIMLDDNRVAIIDPDTFEVVDIIVIA